MCLVNPLQCDFASKALLFAYSKLRGNNAELWLRPSVRQIEASARFWLRSLLVLACRLRRVRPGLTQFRVQGLGLWGLRKSVQGGAYEHDTSIRHKASVLQRNAIIKGSWVGSPKLVLLNGFPNIALILPLYEPM